MGVELLPEEPEPRLRRSKVWLPGYGVTPCDGKWTLSANLGDDIQSLALRLLVEKHGFDFGWYERETMQFVGEYDQRDRNYVMFTGWYAHRGNWPPQLREDAIPIFYGYHDSATEKPDSVPARLKELVERSPLSAGCRDPHTMSVMHRAGIADKKIYQSDCVALTLENVNLGGRDMVIECPLYPWRRCRAPKTEPFKGPSLLAFDLPKYVPSTIFPGFDKWLRGIADSEWTIASQQLDQDVIANPVARTAMAQARLNELRHADLVVTGRLHVALPCVAYGTPVIFLAWRDNIDARLENYLTMFGWVELVELLHIPPLFDDVVERCVAKQGYIAERVHRSRSSFESIAAWIKDRAREDAEAYERDRQRHLEAARLRAEAARAAAEADRAAAEAAAAAATDKGNGEHRE